MTRQPQIAPVRVVVHDDDPDAPASRNVLSEEGSNRDIDTTALMSRMGRRTVDLQILEAVENATQNRVDQMVLQGNGNYRYHGEAPRPDGGSLELEVTERVLMGNLAENVATLKAIGELGVRFAIDDFGTGYSSLSYLTRFPVAALKIDRSFVAGIGRETSDPAIVRTIIEMAHQLGFTVVAEGVETDRQAAFLRQFGCEQAQGYLFAKPAVEALPPAWPTFKAGLHFLLPVVVLVWCLMVELLSPGLAAFYATALMNGFKPNSIVVDGPVCIGNWCPQNYGRSYSGSMTLTTAITRSINVIPVKLSIAMGGREGPRPDAQRIAAGAVIAGAYGHSRFREWMLGGVTRHLATESRRCAFLSR
jgi:hypothetical protein